MNTIHLKSDELLFLLLLGVLVTILGYQFGLGNQTEQLPLILRIMDSSYLQNDFYVESASVFGPRTYYAHLIALFAQWLPLPIVILVLSVLVNVSLAVLSFYAARDLLGGERLAGFIAAILVLSVSSFPLGLVTDIRFVDFQPASIAIPASLAAVWAGLRGRAKLAACIAAIASLPHPLCGVESGAIAICTALCVNLLAPSFTPSKQAVFSLLRQFIAAMAILFTATIVFWVLPQTGSTGEPMTAREVIDILAYFRAPHHYIASDFPITHYAALGFFLIAFAVAWDQWRCTRPGDLRPLKFLLPPLFILLGCAAGYLLVEVYPTRVGMIAQPFRMLFIVKWLGFLFLGHLFAGWIRATSPQPAFAWIALLGSGAAQSAIAFMSVIAEFIDRQLRRIIPGLPHALAPIALLGITLFLTDKAGKINEMLTVIIAMGLALLLSSGKSTILRKILAVSVVAVILATALINRHTQTIESRIVNPIVNWDDHRDDDADIARWGLQHTKSDAIFLIPPNMGNFRALARRAVVIDFEAVPFEDAAMREWRSRIRNCYGEVSSSGFIARRDMEQNYRNISTSQLSRITANYAANYAVLYLETVSSQPTLYANSTYKVISLVEPAASSG